MITEERASIKRKVAWVEVKVLANRQIQGLNLGSRCMSRKARRRTVISRYKKNNMQQITKIQK